jgi:hypothetical protein
VSRYITFLIVVCTLSASAFSQAAIPGGSSPLGFHFPSLPKGEVYGGLQWESFDVHNFLGMPANVAVPRTNFPGFHTSVSFPLHRLLEVEGDLGRSSEIFETFFVANDKLSVSALTILGGPRVRYHIGPLSQFAHVLVGVDHLASKYTAPGTAATGGSTNPFTVAIGGGTSLHVSRYLGFQATVDYVRASTSVEALNNIRVSGGPVFYFGGTKRVSTRYEPAAAPVAAAPPRIDKPTPPPAPQCIEYLVDAHGNEWCLVHAGQDNAGQANQK